MRMGNVDDDDCEIDEVHGHYNFMQVPVDRTSSRATTPPSDQVVVEEEEVHSS